MALVCVHSRYIPDCPDCSEGTEQSAAAIYAEQEWMSSAVRLCARFYADVVVMLAAQHNGHGPGLMSTIALANSAGDVEAVTDDPKKARPSTPEQRATRLAAARALRELAAKLEESC